MNIQQMQYVLAVVEQQNFEKAAAQCFVTQSTLSTMIGKLEDELGIRIFNRKTKPVSITQEGNVLIDRFRIILSEIDSLQNVVQELKGELTGSLKVGVIPTIAPYLLPLLVSEFTHRFPKVKLIIKEMTTEQIQKALLLRQLDLGVLALPLNDDNLNELPLYTEPFVVYDCTEDKKASTVAVQNLDYSKLCLLQEGHCLRSQVKQICELSQEIAKMDVNFEFESGSMDSLISITKSRKALTILPYMAANKLSEQEQQFLMEFEVPVPVRLVGLVTHKYFVKKKLLHELQQIIKDAVLDLIPSTDEHEVMNPLFDGN